MVTLKIQSGDDIIRAYFMNLGFTEKQLPSLTRLIDERFGSIPKDGDELIAFIDKQVLLLAQSVFPHSVLPPEQLLAQFKLVFLLCNGAVKCTETALKNHRLPDGLSEQMRLAAVFLTWHCKRLKHRSRPVFSINCFTVQPRNSLSCRSLSLFPRNKSAGEELSFSG